MPRSIIHLAYDASALSVMLSLSVLKDPEPCTFHVDGPFQLQLLCLLMKSLIWYFHRYHLAFFVLTLIIDAVSSSLVSDVNYIRSVNKILTPGWWIYAHAFHLYWKSELSDNHFLHYIQAAFSVCQITQSHDGHALWLYYTSLDCPPTPR